MDNIPDSPNRREFIAAAAAGAAILPNIGNAKAHDGKPSINHALMGWCIKMDKVELAKAAKEVGITAMEGINRKFYPDITKLGMGVSLVGSHGFKDGPTDKKNKNMVIDKLKDGIDAAVQWKCRNVITFTGMAVDGLSRKQQDANCVEAWKSVMDYAEEKGVNVCLEHLNSLDHGHPMKGHPGYYGDDVDHCVELIGKVGSPRMKLLFDIYHVQIMNGDVVRRLRLYKDVIAHIHTAGNPGRNELHSKFQEINYPGIMRALVDIGYDGYVAHEFIPEEEDAIASLKKAVEICSV
jgi:hydroxypyruvate isomerase